ncbi:MAG: hypothetical protein U0M51_01785 [Eggerthellaceae bacterium]
MVQIASLGTTFASLPETFRTVTLQNNGTLMEAFTKAGDQLNISQLHQFSDGAGSLGAIKDATKGIGGQAHLRTAEGAVATLPYDPSMLALGLALASINQKLDAIQKTQQEMFDYMKQKDKAQLRADLQTLVDILEGYRYNWDNETFRRNKHAKALDIRQAAEQSITHLRAQINSKLSDKKLLESRLGVSRKIDEVLDRLKEYQLSVYLYAFSAFVEVMVLENFDSDYLDAITKKIEGQSLRYRQMYTDCYNAIEQLSTSSIDSTVLDGVASAGKALGKSIERTPIGDKTQIDEKLEDAGKDIASFNDEHTSKLLEKLHQAKAPEIMVFSESLATVNMIYNRPTRILFDAENVYALPLAQCN